MKKDLHQYDFDQMINNAKRDQLNFFLLVKLTKILLVPPKCEMIRVLNFFNITIAILDFISIASFKVIAFNHFCFIFGHDFFLSLFLFES